jgi:hypothetical protein
MARVLRSALAKMPTAVTLTLASRRAGKKIARDAPLDLSRNQAGEVIQRLVLTDGHPERALRDEESWRSRRDRYQLVREALSLSSSCEELS